VLTVLEIASLATLTRDQSRPRKFSVVSTTVEAEPLVVVRWIVHGDDDFRYTQANALRTLPRYSSVVSILGSVIDAAPEPSAFTDIEGIPATKDSVVDLVMALTDVHAPRSWGNLEEPTGIRF
jgi:hypothetical protein